MYHLSDQTPSLPAAKISLWTLFKTWEPCIDWANNKTADERNSPQHLRYFRRGKMRFDKLNIYGGLNQVAVCHIHKEILDEVSKEGN